VNERVPAGADTVLVVDDFAALREQYRGALEAEGLRVDEAGDGAGALAAIARSRPGAVVLDVSMPEVDGYGVLAALRADPATATLPVMLVTGESDVSTGLHAGADDFLAKPFRSAELVARVHALLRKEHAWRGEVDRRMANRSRQLDVLAHVDPGSDAATTARRIVDGLHGTGGLDAVAVIALEHDDARLLAASPPPPLSVPGSLGSSVSRLLERKAIGHPFLDAASLRDAHSWTDAPDAFAPLRRGPVCFGFLALRVTGSPGVGLATAIDLAPAVSGLLAGDLCAPAAESVTKAGIQSVLLGRAFHCVFQPVVDLVDRRPIGFEALTRFADGTRPDVRFQEAAQVGLGPSLESATMRNACEASVSLDPGAWISINVSPSLLRAPDLFAPELAAVDRDVVLEVTEREPIDDYDDLRARLSALPGTPRLAVDDAGAGYSSLRHILQLHPEFIKLDGTWVHGVDTDRARQALIAGLQLFAREAGMTLIAEGVETTGEAATLLDLGVDYAQGFLFGHPEVVRTPIVTGVREDGSRG
jgi:EAL domain-containing protein (putative c-di-GMP-specific phosphodiesterase class I)/CheY-like chemotaxis protein